MSSDDPCEAVVPFGDRALRFVIPPGIDRRALLSVLAAPPVVDVVLTETLGAVMFPRDEDRTAAEEAVRSALVSATTCEAVTTPAGRPHLIEVVYDGDDLDAIAMQLSMSRDAVVALHADRDYEVAMLGFLPGFAYLRGVDERLVIPRRATPRTKVPIHSVAVAADHRSLSVQLPWRLASPRARLRLHAVRGARSPLRRRRPREIRAPGDLRLERSERPRCADRGRGTNPWESGARGITDVVGPALVVDAGRPGHARSGVPSGGPMVYAALARANQAVENERGACGIELYGSMTVTARGGDLVVADDVTGARLLAQGEAHRVATSALTRVRYLAVTGGLDVPTVLGSRCTLLVAALGGWGGRLLRRGDKIPVDCNRLREPEAPPTEPSPTQGQPIAIDSGPDVLANALDILLGATFRVAHASDRTGTRLEGPPLPHDVRVDRPSAPMVRGAIQLTTGGLVVLGPDHPTTGGYPVIGVVRQHAQGPFFLAASRQSGEILQVVA